MRIVSGRGWSIALRWLESAVFSVSAPVCVLCIWARLTFGRIHYYQIALHCGWDNLPYVPRIYLVWFGLYCLASLAVCALYGRLVVAGLPGRIRRWLAPGPRLVLYLKLLNLVFLAALVETAVWMVFFEFYFPFRRADVCEFSTCLEEQYVPAIQAELRFPERRRNLVYIVCESLEDAFSHPEFFGADLMPELTRLAAENDSFPGCRSVYGVDCTALSLHAGQFAFPVTNISEYGRSIDSETVPDSTYRCLSLFHILGENGYQTSFMRGAGMAFANSHLIYRSAPGIRIHSLDELRDDPEYRRLPRKSEWGVNDRILWKHVKSEILSLSRCGRPFALQVLTLDTHFPTWYVGDGETREFNDYRDAVVLASRMLDEFLAWLGRQDFYEDTVVAITGDHVAFPRTIPLARIRRIAPGFQRTVYDCFLNSAVRPKKPAVPEGQRVWAIFDMMPTLLEAMGVTWQSHRLGVGTSLYSGEKTWLEKIGPDVYECEMQKRSRFLLRLH